MGLELKFDGGLTSKKLPLATDVLGWMGFVCAEECDCGGGLAKLLEVLNFGGAETADVPKLRLAKASSRPPRVDCGGGEKAEEVG